MLMDWPWAYITYMESNMKLLTGKTAIMAGIAAVAASGVKWEQDVQILAMSTMTHSVKHREVSLMNALVDALPNGARTNALRDYFNDFSCATWVEAQGKNPAHFAFDKDKKADLKGAAETTWASYKKEKPYAPIDICKTLTALLNRVEKDTKTEYNPDLVSGLKTLVDSHKEVFEPNH